MVSPNHMCNYSLITNKVQIHGNIELVNSLKEIVKEKCIDVINLYEAQEIIRKYCIENYGIDFYEKNAEVISFIIENEYCHVERKKLPSFNMKRYKEDMQKGVMY